MYRTLIIATVISLLTAPASFSPATAMSEPKIWAGRTHEVALTACDRSAKSFTCELYWMPTKRDQKYIFRSGTVYVLDEDGNRFWASFIKVGNLRKAIPSGERRTTLGRYPLAKGLKTKIFLVFDNITTEARIARLIIDRKVQFDLSK